MSSVSRLPPSLFLSSSYLLCVVLLLMSILHSTVSSVRTDVRCYCNLPACVSSGYMCKSSLGVCVSDHFLDSQENAESPQSSSRHACLELLQTRQIVILQEEPSSHLECSEEDNDSQPKKSPIRTCCREDMCNYARSDSLAHHQNNNIPIHRLNQSFMTGYFSNDDYLFVHGGVPASNWSADRQNDLWFKAAVIAVPIAGGFILILLIVMAARMLKEDHKNLLPPPPRAPPLDTRVVFNSSSSHRLVLMPKSVSTALIHPQFHKDFNSATDFTEEQQQRQHPNHFYPNPLYKNASIALSTDTSYSDSSRDKYFVFDV